MCYVCMCVCVHLCVHVCVCVYRLCMHVCICIYLETGETDLWEQK